MQLIPLTGTETYSGGGHTILQFERMQLIPLTGTETRYESPTNISIAMQLIPLTGTETGWKG